MARSSERVESSVLLFAEICTMSLVSMAADSWVQAWVMVAGRLVFWVMWSLVMVIRLRARSRRFWSCWWRSVVFLLMFSSNLMRLWYLDMPHPVTLARMIPMMTRTMIQAGKRLTLMSAI